MKIVYVSKYSSVFYSQVIEHLNHLVDLGHDVTLITTHDFRTNKFKVISFTKYPDYPFLLELSVKALYRAFKEAKINRRTIVHVRTEILYVLVRKAIQRISSKYSANILLDIRGAIYQEFKLYNNMSLFQRFIKMIMLLGVKKDIKLAQNISVVSPQLLKYVKWFYGFSSENININNCLAGSRFKYDEAWRENIRNELNILADEVLVVFQSGGMAAWQQTNEVFQAFSNIKVKYLILGSSKFNYPNTISLKVDYKDVPKYLCAADIGVIFRENNIVNNVALPVKYCEYLSCGLPVVANESVHEIKTSIRVHNVGYVLESGIINEGILSILLKLDRHRIAKVGQNNYSVVNVVEGYSHIYNQIESLQSTFT
jgi:hypothetical protein